MTHSIEDGFPNAHLGEGPDDRGFKQGPREDQSCGGGGGADEGQRDTIPGTRDVSPQYPKSERVE